MVQERVPIQKRSPIPGKKHVQESIQYLLITLASFIVLQALLVVMHELTHSTTAWLLGDMKNPLAIVWGNPLTMTGWDEGVSYSKLFSGRHSGEEALIGASPLMMHLTIVILGLNFLQKQWLFKRKWIFHALFWFVAANFMELIAYIFMRPFAEHGDTGHFNHGLNLSPWILFILGSLALTIMLYVYYRKVVPRAYALFSNKNTYIKWTILILSAFIIFLWGSGIRVMAYVPGPQWMFGLLGIPAFLLIVILFRPKRDIS